MFARDMWDVTMQLGIVTAEEDKETHNQKLTPSDNSPAEKGGVTVQEKRTAGGAGAETTDR